MQKICSEKTYNEINNLYNKKILLKKLKKFLKKNEIFKIIKFMKNDKKKDDEKVSFIFLKNIGKTTMPGKHKYKVTQIENIIKKLF
mgnify:CR=1 FL=1